MSMHKRRQGPAGGVGIWLALALAGCGGEQMPLGRVSGVVTWEGRPLQGGVIHFVPAAGPAAQGLLDERGRYELSTYTEGDGVVIGRHAVYLTPSPAEQVEFTEADYLAGKVPPAPAAPPFLPARYLSSASSGLSAEVDAGSNTFDFVLPGD